MNCPLCNVTLQMADRQGIEIDYCPKCRGIWLDRGELEKLVELSAGRSTASSSPPPSSYPPASYQPQDSRGYDDRGNSYADPRNTPDYRYSKPKKRESWLGELFDF